MAEKMTLDKLALITAHGFEELHGKVDEFRGKVDELRGEVDEFRGEIKSLKKELKAEINDLRKEVRAGFKLVQSHYDGHERRITRLEEKVL